MQGMRKAIFLDRDGTINEEVGYLDHLDRLVLFPGAPEAIGKINESGMAAVVITNQSGVARGYFDETFVMAVHMRMQELLATQRAHLDALYYCPHHPEGQGAYRLHCDCRKPEPGMILRAAADLRIDLGHSYMIGDNLKDMEMAERAGVTGVLVRTGYGREVENAQGGCTAFPVVDTILEAVTWILKDQSA